MDIAVVLDHLDLRQMDRRPNGLVSPIWHRADELFFCSHRTKPRKHVWYENMSFHVDVLAGMILKIWTCESMNDENIFFYKSHWNDSILKIFLCVQVDIRGTCVSKKVLNILLSAQPSLSTIWSQHKTINNIKNMQNEA